MMSPKLVSAESGATCPRHDIESMCFGETTLIGNETAISPVVEVRVCCDSALSQPMAHPPGGPSKIAAGASAPRKSPTEVDARIACLGLWRYRLGRYQAQYIGPNVHPVLVFSRKACGGKAVANSARAVGKPASDEDGDSS
jgi:hypothetical protein